MTYPNPDMLNLGDEFPHERPLPQTVVGNIEEYVRAEREMRGRIRTVRNPSSQDAVAYLHPGQVELWLRKEVTHDALLKLRDFVDGLVAEGARRR